MQPEKKSSEGKVSNFDSPDLLIGSDAGAKTVTEVRSEPDVCSECGTNLAAKRKDRERRRRYMKDRRAEKK